MAGALFKVCESYAEAQHLLEEHFKKETDSPIFLGTDPRGPPFLSPVGERFPSCTPQSKEKRPFEGHYDGFRRAQHDGGSVEVERS
jgi:hypothetical protein